MGFFKWLFGYPDYDCKCEPEKAPEISTKKQKRFNQLKPGEKFIKDGRVAVRGTTRHNYYYQDSPDVFYNFYDTYMLLYVLGALDGEHNAALEHRHDYDSVNDSLNKGDHSSSYSAPEPSHSHDYGHSDGGGGYGHSHSSYDNHSSYDSGSSHSYDSGGSCDSGGGSCGGGD